MAEDLHLLEEWFGRIMAGLAPPQRRRAALKLGRLLRRSNLQRVAANVTPEGAPMERKKPRLDRHGRLRAKAGGKMFRGLRLQRNWPIDAQPDGVEIRPRSGLVDRIGSVSQFGEVATVGRLRDGRKIRVRYAERPLLGFSEADQLLALDVAAELIEPKVVKI